MSEEVKQEGDFKIKKKPSMKKLVKQPEVVKVDLSAKKEIEPEVTRVEIKSQDAVQEQSTDASNDTIEKSEDSKDSENVVEEVRPTDDVKDTASDDGVQVLQEITDEEEEKEVIADTVEESKEVNKPLPENIEKLVSFMDETGGDIEDYVRLNANYDDIDSKTLLKEYYRKNKPHLDEEEISFILEDKFEYDEEIDEEREIRKKKLAFKEEVAEAKGFLKDLKSKYYDEIKLRPGVTQEQKKAVDFFNRYNEEKQIANDKLQRFQKGTSELLNNDFKGFDFEVGEKKFRYNINNPSKVAEEQSNISNFVGKFLGKKGEVVDQKSYHKALYAASNVDKIVNHFYEQGKADAIKDVVSSSKNISDKPRQAASDSVFINGLRVKSVNGVDSSKLRIKKSKFNN